MPSHSWSNLNSPGLSHPTCPLAPALPASRGLTQQEPQEPWSLISLMVGQFGHCSRASKLSGRIMPSANAALEKGRSPSQAVTLEPTLPSPQRPADCHHLEGKRHKDMQRRVYARVSPWNVIYLFKHFFFFWLCRAACRILVPRPGIEPGPSAVRPWSPNHRTTREFPPLEFYKTK